jgi:hypothetical protein
MHKAKEDLCLRWRMPFPIGNLGGRKFRASGDQKNKVAMNPWRLGRFRANLNSGANSDSGPHASCSDNQLTWLAHTQSI